MINEKILDPEDVLECPNCGAFIAIRDMEVSTSEFDPIPDESTGLYQPQRYHCACDGMKNWALAHDKGDRIIRSTIFSREVIPA